jgi:hypothetical protein
MVRVTVENLAPGNGVALSPFTVGFHDGSFDAFDAGSAAGLGTQNVAELGDGTQWLAEFAAAQPGGVSGVVAATVNAFGPGIYLPGGSGSMDFTLDRSANRYFSFGAMTVPSNDRFVGNDSGTAIEIFDAGGNFVATTMTLFGSNIWDAGTEVDAPFGAAFLAGQDAMDHVGQGGVVTLSSDFAAYSGEATAAGYDFVDLPAGDDALVRISFAVVPAPGVCSIGVLGALGAVRRRR